MSLGGSLGYIDYRGLGLGLGWFLDSASFRLPCCSCRLLDNMVALIAEHEVNHVAVARTFLLTLLALSAFGLSLITLGKQGMIILDTVAHTRGM